MSLFFGQRATSSETAELLKTYLEALKVLNAALDAQDIVKAMIAQGRVVEAATKLVTHEQ